MDLLNCLKYILPLTILFDAVVSLLLIRKSVQDTVIRYYCLALGTLVLWEVLFWFSIFTNYQAAQNSWIDRLAYIAALIVQYLLLKFLFSYLKINFSQLLQRLVFSLVALTSLVILVFGVGERQYIGLESHQYFLGSGVYSSSILTIYSAISIALTAFCFYTLSKMFTPELSVFEIARRRLMRNSIGFSLCVTLIPILSLPLVVLMTGGQWSEMLASNWYSTVIVFAAVCSSVWTATTAYALTRYRLFDVTVRVQRSLILMACILVITVTITLLNQYVIKTIPGEIEPMFLFGGMLCVGLIVVVWLTKQIGWGESLSFALLEPIQASSTTQDLTQKLQRYLRDEFGIPVHATYIFDVATKQLAHSHTGEVIHLSQSQMIALQHNQIIYEQLPLASKPAVALIPLVYNGYLVGVTATMQTVDVVVLKNLQPFIGLIYQALFASYLKMV